MGKEYLDKGEVDNAISRFQSSIDLDENIFESRYNLGVAYIQKNDYNNAIIQLKKAIEINPKSSDAYYSYAVALENQGLKFEEILDGDKNKPTKEEMIENLKIVDKSIKMYQNYLSNLKTSPDDSVEVHIKELQNLIVKYKEEYKIEE